MRVEVERRRSVRVEPNAPATSHGHSAVAKSAHGSAGLDWQSFSAAHFPGRRRHDLEALTAYSAYRRAREADVPSLEERARIEAGRSPTGATALHGWEDEGGATS